MRNVYFNHLGRISIVPSDEKYANEVAQEIQIAFADVDLPEVGKLVTNPNHYEADEVIEDFGGKHWNDITLEVAYWHRLSLPLFTPEAFHFYIPAFLVKPLLAPFDSEYNPGEILEFAFYSLLPLEDEERYQMKKLLENVKKFTPQQHTAVRKFIEYFLKTNPFLPETYVEKAKKFWKS